MSGSYAEACTHSPPAYPPIVSIAPITLPSPGRGIDLHVPVSAPITGAALPVIVLSHGNGQSLSRLWPPR